MLTSDVLPNSHSVKNFHMAVSTSLDHWRGISKENPSSFLHDDKMNNKVHWWEQTLKSLLVILVHWDKHLNSSRIYVGKQSCILLPYCF